jgi:hypothetical protein
VISSVVAVAAGAGVVAAAVTSHPDHAGGVDAAGGVRPPGAAPTAPSSPDSKNPGAFADMAAADGSPHPARLLRAAQTRGLVEMPWRLGHIEPGGNAVDVLVADGDGSCVTAAGIEVLETGSSVEVLALSRAVHLGDACPARLMVTYTRVPLAAPLAARALLHGPVDSRWGKVLPLS